MDVASVAPFPVGIVRFREPAAASSVVVKVTFSLRHRAEAQLAREQLPLYDYAQQVAHPADFVPGKKQVDVVLVGHARATKPAEVIPFRFAVAQLERELFAHAPTPVVDIPLVDDNVRRGSAPDSAIVQVGPIRNVGHEDGAPAADLDVFNVAPAEQRLEELELGCMIELEALAAEPALLQSRLPGQQPCVFCLPRGTESAPQRLAMRCDTLVLDSDRLVATLVWRGRVPELPDQASAALVVGVEPAGAPLRWRELERQLARVGWAAVCEADDWTEIDATSPQDLHDTVDDVESEPSTAREHTTPSFTRPLARTIPFEAIRREPPAKVVFDGPPAGAGKTLIDTGEEPYAEQTQDVSDIAGEALPFTSDDGPPPVRVGEEIAREGGELASDTAPVARRPDPPLPFDDEETVEPPTRPAPPARVETDRGVVAPALVHPPNPLAAQGHGSEPPKPAILGPAPEPAREDEASTTEQEPESVPQQQQVEDERLRTVDDVSLELCASIRAACDLQPQLRDAIVADERLELETWEAAERRWKERLASAAQRADKETTEGYDDAYLARLERERGPIDVTEYARLELAVEQGRIDDLVVDLGIPRPAVIRIKRVWTRRLLDDRPLRDEMRAKLNELRG